MKNAEELFFEFLRFPSVSTDPSRSGEMLRCAEWTSALLESYGFESSLMPTAGQPAVVARWHGQPGAPTALVYGHYDVQPAEPLELWESPPFEPVVREGRVYARGATDNKGQILAHILGIGERLRKDGKLPVNVTFLIEGEEEIGSPNLNPLLQQHPDLFRCDVAVVSDTGMIGPGIPTLTYGLRGICCLEVELTGPAGDLHSGIYGGAVQNPATALARLLATLHDAEGRILVKGFYDEVRELHDWEREGWAQLPIGDEQVREWTGVGELHGETGYNSLERVWARPTVEINGMAAGYQGEGTKTIIPSRAMAKLSCRLVPNQTAQATAKLMEAHLREHAPPGVALKVTVQHGGEAYWLDPRSGWGLAAQQALRRCFDKEPALICEGGSVPIVQSFKTTLGADTLLLGLALPDANLHAPNENFPLENFRVGQKLTCLLLDELSETRS